LAYFTHLRRQKCIGDDVEDFKIGSWDSRKTAIKGVGWEVKPGARLGQTARTFRRFQLLHNPFKSLSAESQSCIHSKNPFHRRPIKARAKLLSMLFPYLVMLLILLPFVLFRKHSGLVQHNLCGARRRVKWRVRKCAGRWAFLHRKSRLRRSLIPKFLVRGGLPPRAPPARAPRFGLRPQWISLQPISCLIQAYNMGIPFSSLGWGSASLVVCTEQPST
jgi:hypothetical protein